MSCVSNLVKILKELEDLNAREPLPSICMFFFFLLGNTLEEYWIYYRT